MKISILNAFPNLSHSAEREFIQRSLVILTKAGHQAVEVITSDDIIQFDPDFVVVSHEFVPKLTHHFTVGLLWSPTQFYKNDIARIRAIRSWDLVVPINDATRHFARDIHFPMRHLSAVSDLNFYPSAPVNDLPLPDPSKLSLAYVGAHWDGRRHKDLLQALAEVVDLHVYGPPEAWKHMPAQYRGPIPFDGDSLIRTLNRHGAVLAIHKAAHVQEDTPSMRVFESCAAKCLVFTDTMPSLANIFGDAVQYVDLESNPKAVARAIAETIRKYKSAPTAFVETVRRADSIFREKASLDRLLSALLEDVERCRAAHRMSDVNGTEGFDVTVIIRCGSRPISMIQRAVASVQNQTYKRIGIVFPRYAEIEGFGEWLQNLRASGRFLFLTDLPVRGDGVRSVAMWAGFRAVQTELFCLLDDDDELFPNHISDLVGVLRKHPDIDFTYCGVIRQEEEGAFLDDHARFKGDMNQRVGERRALQFFSDFNLDRLLRFDNFIQSNAWLARKRVLTLEVLDDPEMEVCEDMYFYLLLASERHFRFSGTVSAIWNWRRLTSDNSMTAVSRQRWAHAGERLARRLAQVSFKGGYQGHDVIVRGIDGRWKLPSEAKSSPANLLPSENENPEGMSMQHMENYFAQQLEKCRRSRFPWILNPKAWLLRINRNKLRKARLGRTAEEKKIAK
jgi:hypothetical protein